MRQNQPDGGLYFQYVKERLDTPYESKLHQGQKQSLAK